MVMTTYTSSHRSSLSRDSSREGKLTPRGQLAPRVSLTSCSRAFPGHRQLSGRVSLAREKGVAATCPD